MASDARVLSLFVDEYGVRWRYFPRTQHEQNRTAEEDRAPRYPTSLHSRLGLVRVACSVEYLYNLIYYLGHLGQLARNGNFSICVAAPHFAVANMGRDRGIQVAMDGHNGVDGDILAWVQKHLVADSIGLGERDELVDMIGERSKGLILWAEVVVDTVNMLCEDGVSPEVLEGIIKDIPSSLDGLYTWLFERLDAEERADALVLMQWVLLAAEPLRLNELLVAVRLTITMSGPRVRWELYSVLDVEPAMSVRDLRKPDGQGFAIDTPTQFHEWIRRRSQGLVKLDSEARSAEGKPNEPLGLQRVLPIHDSVWSFFLKGKGFHCLSPLPGLEPLEQSSITTQDLVDEAYFTLLHACLEYLNMTDFESLGRGTGTGPSSSSPATDPMSMPDAETTRWRKTVDDQRKLMLSYPLLQYAVDNLVFHILTPRLFRYFVPQMDLLRMFTANDCRLWRRWTRLLGISIADANSSTIIARASQSRPTRRLLHPVYGARYRLERVLKKVWRTAVEQNGQPKGRDGRARPRTPRTPKSADSSGTLYFALDGGGDPGKAQWLLGSTSPSTSPKGGGGGAFSPIPTSPGDTLNLMTLFAR